MQRSTLPHDAPSALGETPLREAHAESAAMLAAGLESAMRAGALPERPASTIAQLLHGLLCRAALIVARSDEPDALEDVITEVDTVLDGLERPG